MNHRFLSYVLGIIIIGLLVMPQPSAAQEETEYVGLDVVFLIDQSGSMGGPEAGCTICTYANDPLGLRFAAPEFAIELLGDDLLQGQIARQTPVDVQVGIVSFGSTAQISLGPALIQATTEEEWIAEWNSIGSDLNKIRAELSTDNLRRTDPKLAFQKAQDLFADMASNPAVNQGPRLKAIIVLTDGSPCTGDCNPPESFWSPEQVQDYLADLRDEVRGGGSQSADFPYDEYQILVIGMKDPVDAYWNYTSNLWSEIADGNAFLANNEAEAGFHLYQFLNPLLQSIGGRTGEPWEFGVDRSVAPYLRQSVFTTCKSAQGAVPVDIRENGISLDLTGGKDNRIRVTGDETSPIQTIVVTDPQPGAWVVFQTSESDVSVWARTIEFQVSPSINPQSNGVQYLPLSLSFTLRDERGNPPPVYADPKYALTPEVTIKTPIGIENLPITTIGEDQYEVAFVPTATGEYTWHLTVSTSNVDNSILTLVDTDISSFDISPLQAVLDKPEGLFYQNTTISSSFRVIDAQGRTIIPPETWDISAQVLGPEEEPPVSLVDEQGVYEVLFTPADSGTYDLTITINGVDHQDRPFTVVDDKLASYTVRPTTTLDFDITHPAQHTVREEISWWSWRLGEVGQLLPYTVTIQLRTDTGNTIAAEDVGEGNLDPFALTLHAPDGTSQSVALTSTGAPGEYKAQVDVLEPLGEWELEVVPRLNLVPDYLMNQQAKTTRLTLSDNPTAIRYQQTWDRWFPIGSVSLATLLAVLLIWRLLLMRNACQGTIMVVDEFEAVVQPLDLGSKRKNSIIFRGSSLPAATRLKRLEVRRPGKENNVLVTATLTDGSKPITSQSMIHDTKIHLVDDLYLKYINYASSGMDGGAYAYNV